MSPMIVFLALFGAAMANPQWGPHGGAPQNWGGAPAPVQDTAEVAAAKAAHYAALSRAGTQPQANQWNSNEDNGQWNGDDGSRWSDNSQQWSQQAQPQQWNQQAQPQQWNQQAQPQWNPNQRWQGPVALPPGFDNNGAPLPVRDTPEVAAEKARHLALATGSPAPGAWNAAPAPSWNAAPNPTWNAAPNWNAPAGGAPADTPEVAAARAAHLAAHQAATGHRWKRSAIALASPLTAHIATPWATPVLASPIIRTSWSSHLTPIVSHW